MHVPVPAVTTALQLASTQLLKPAARNTILVLGRNTRQIIPMSSRLLYTEAVTDGSCQDTGIRIMHLNKPDTLNSLTTDMGAEFSAELAKLEADHGKRVLIITGSGRAFSAGGDFGFIEERIKGEQRENAKVRS